MATESDYMMSNWVTKFKPMEPDGDYELQNIENLISRLNMSTIPSPVPNTSALKQLEKRIGELEEQVRRLTHENEYLKFENQLLKQNIESKNKKIIIK